MSLTSSRVMRAIIENQFGTRKCVLRWSRGSGIWGEVQLNKGRFVGASMNEDSSVDRIVYLSPSAGVQEIAHGFCAACTMDWAMAYIEDAAERGKQVT